MFPDQILLETNYRHFNELLTNFALGDRHPAYPVVEMGERSRELKIGQNVPAAAEPKDNPACMRWNNFGISLLDQAQYAKAKDALSEVLKLRPDYWRRPHKPGGALFICDGNATPLLRPA